MSPSAARKTLVSRAAVLALALGLWVSPVPEGLVPAAWHLFALFVAAIVSVVIGAFPILTASVLALASTYGTKYTVIYAFWDEEEIGLVGSHYYASQAYSNQEQIQGVLNLDMIGWDANDDYLADIHTQNTASSNDIANLLVVTDYLYNLPVKPIIYNPGTWQSDHSSFWNRGFGAVLLIEAYYGGDLNPYYHTDGDSVGNFNLPFFHGMAGLSIAALATLTEPTKDPVIASVAPDTGYQTYQSDITIKGFKTHFQQESGSTTVWLSRNSDILNSDSVRVVSDTSLHAYFVFPLSANPGLWNVNVQTSTDGILSAVDRFTILPAQPTISVSVDSLTITVPPGGTAGSVPIPQNFRFLFSPHLLPENPGNNLLLKQLDFIYRNRPL